MEWKFLLDILADMNFGQRWITWIKTCISTASIAVLVNGLPSDFFAIEWGLRQGDPLSPLLFNICVSGFSCMLNQLLGEKLFSGVKWGDGVSLNHLQPYFSARMTKINWRDYATHSLPSCMLPG